MDKWYMYFWYKRDQEVYPVGGVALQQGSRGGEHIYQIPIPRIGEKVTVEKVSGIVRAVEYDYEKQEVNVQLGSERH